MLDRPSRGPTTDRGGRTSEDRFTNRTQEMQKTNLSIDEHLNGYVARPSGTGPFPGIVVLMEAFGLKHHIQRACDRLAHAGFVAVAPDIYHGVSFEYTDMDKVLNHIRTVDDNRVMDETATTFDWLTGQSSVDAANLGVVGFCTGGRLAFLAATRFPERLRAAVCFYGGSIAPDEEDRFDRTPPIIDADRIKSALFLGYGAEDKSIGAMEHARIARTLSDLNKRYTMAVYPAAGHAFLCEERQSFAPKAAARAWQEAVDFLNRELVVQYLT
jgi:carboxymethylenebutenolidase